MKTWIKFASAALVVVLISVTFGGATTANAQAGNANNARKIIAQAVLDAVSEATGVAQADLVKQLADGTKSLNDILAEHNADIAAVKAQIKTSLTTIINQAVTDGKLERAKADHALKNLDKLIDAALARKFPDAKVAIRDQRLKGAALDILFQTVAKDTNVSQRDLLQALRDGKTLAQVAAEHQVDSATIISDAIKLTTKRIDVLVKNAKMKQADADKFLASLPDFFTQKMNVVNPLDGRQPGGKKGNKQPTPQATPEPNATPNAPATPSL